MTTRDYSCFFSGLGAGVCLALVFAPRSGSQLRTDIHDRMDQGRQILRDRKSAAYKAVEREKDGISAAIEAGKQAYREATGGRRKHEASAASAI